MPKLGMTILQYLWCWAVVILVHLTPEPSVFSISGYGHYFYVGSISGIAAYLLIKWAGKNYLAFVLCSFELLAILLQLTCCYGHFTKKANWFYNNYSDILLTMYNLQVALLTVAGIYGFGLLLWNIGNSVFNSGSDNSHKSHVWPLLYERRKTQR